MREEQKRQWGKLTVSGEFTLGIGSIIFAFNVFFILGRSSSKSMGSEP
jgi:hypothetical protein